MIQQISNVKDASYNQMKTLICDNGVFSVFYFMRRKKDRLCDKRTQIKNNIMELLGGCLAWYCFHRFMFPWESLTVFSIFMIWLAIMLIDFDTMTIPNELIFALIIPVCIMSMMHQEMTLMTRVIGCFVISLPMYIVIRIIPNCFGGGDVKLIAVCGFLLGGKNTLLAGFISVFAGGIYAICLLICGKAKKHMHIAFGPFLIIGAAVAVLYGNELIALYLSLCEF